VFISFLYMRNSTLHTRQSSTQNNKCQVLHKYSFSPDDGHIVARNMERKEINRLRKTVHQVDFIYKKEVVFAFLERCSAQVGSC